MRHLILPLLLSAALLPTIGVSPVYAQGHQRQHRQGGHGMITGQVQFADGQSADHVSVRVKGTNRGTSPTADGNFRVEAPLGWQTLIITCLGCTPQEVMIEVKADEIAVVPPANLVQGNKELDEVTVTATRSINERPSSIGKLPIRPLDLPQSIVTVDRHVLEQQQALRLSDVLTNVPGLYVMSATGGTQEELGSRGFAYGSNNTFKNGVRFNNGAMPEVSSLERMEVLKGSAAILYGNVAAGGVLNIVTKKPQFERGGSVGLRVGSFGLFKPMFDVYGAVGQSTKVAFRLNGTYEQANSYRDVVKSDRVYVNPSLLFRLSPKTSLTVEGDYLRDNRTPDYGVGAIDYQVQESRTRFLNTSDALNATQQTSATATLASRLSDVWQVRAVAGFQRYDNELRSASRPTTFATSNPLSARYGDLGRNLQRSATAENYFTGQLDLTGTFRTGSIGHTLLLGADADQYNTNALSYFAQAYDSVNIFNRGKELRSPKGAVSGYDALKYNTRTLGNTRRAGFYAQDLISLLDNVKLLAGLRWSYQETPSDVYNYRATVKDATGKTVVDAANNPLLVTTVTENKRYDNAFSPRLGLVYQPIKTMSVFASYSNSFTPNSGFDLSGKALEPSLIDQYEVGVKNDLFRGALSANVTAYRIVNSNQVQSILPTDPRFATSQTTTPQELAGEVTSKGVEVDVQSRPTQGWTFISGYSYNHTAYTRSTLYSAGSRLRYNPTHTANFSLFYNFGQTFVENTFLKGLTAGVTSYYVGDRLAGRNPRLVNPATGLPFPNGDVNKYIAAPNYFLFDASLGYAYRNFQLRVKMANLLDELSYNLHDDNSVNPIAPRNFSATLSYKL
ncbi:TonB-dependent siderophore receptor [Hymenobacter sp. BT683]|uniref:TonB-dependent siderophore receptor n=1 Tax=Hymenobacter jeongseonensis TaxID=2791027 RepID=A0ABS0IE01_9BACT|nr:TonB-dependent receptor [Hymenobacter jeongseonensis]MBF9236568.1 TonB-dependent siderophore receptor [Hymenobacter jeongseonensis]